jgi:hypothetical protein
MTNFYTINYESDLLDEVKVASSMKSSYPSVQNDQMERVKKKRSISSDRPDVIRSNWHDDPTEITTEILQRLQVNPLVRLQGNPTVKWEADPEVLITDQAILVLNHLNTVAVQNFKCKTSLENIRARLREGHTVIT